LIDGMLHYRRSAHPSPQRLRLARIMKTANRLLPFAAFTAAAVLAGCASRSNVSTSPYATPAAPAARTERGAPPSSGIASSTATYDAYKRELAQHISTVNAASVYPGRPQALLRSVIVVKYVVDAHGSLVRSEIVRSNRDSETESTALSTLRRTAPFPKPASHLLRRGQVEITETWLFNNDGRFQLRTIAQPQADS
jgi:protein TonB